VLVQKLEDAGTDWDRLRAFMTECGPACPRSLRDKAESRLTPVEADVYQGALGDINKLQDYIRKCIICAHKGPALDEIAAIEEKERLRRAEREKAEEEARKRAEKEKAEEEARKRAEKEKAEEEARKKAEKEKAEEEARKRAEKEQLRKSKSAKPAKPARAKPNTKKTYAKPAKTPKARPAPPDGDFGTRAVLCNRRPTQCN